jgi:polyisoprenoid-binding protein YceI
MKPVFLALTVSAFAGPLFAQAETYTLDPSHSQVAFSYEHAGLSTTYGLVSGFEGAVVFNREHPAQSSVQVSIAADRLVTGWDERDDQLLGSGNFFDLAAFPAVTFQSTSIEVTGENTALITGDLTLNGITKLVVLDAQKAGETDAYFFPPYDGKKAVGFNATATLMRSDFNLGLFAPYIGDAVTLNISIEAMKLD